jgi:hypothetical protein
MPTAAELRALITANRQKLLAALSEAGETWESADDDGWSPRRAAEHCIERDGGLAGIAAAARRGEPPAEEFARTGDPEATCLLQLATAAEATTALEATGAASDAALAGLEDDALARPAELNAGSLPNTLEGVLTLTAWHLNDHAEQIAKMR